MKKNKFLPLIAAFMLLPFLLCANGVGSTMDKVLKSDFANFFNITEQSSEKINFQQALKHYKTGGFKEFIDLDLTVDKGNLLIVAALDVKYEFIKTQRVFAIDVIKSFIKDFAHENDRSVTTTLSDRLYSGEGEVDEKLEVIMQVFNNEKTWAVVELNNCVFEMNLGKTALQFKFYFKNWKEQLIDKKILLQKKQLANTNLMLTEEKPTFNVWTLEKEKTGDVSRLVDGRWSFETEEQAANYYRAFNLQQSEGAKKVTDFKEKLGEELSVYFLDNSNNEMMKALLIKDKFYYFYFRKGKHIAKVFVVANENVAIEKAFAIAKKAEKLLVNLRTR